MTHLQQGVPVSFDGTDYGTFARQKKDLEALYQQLTPKTDFVLRLATDLEAASAILALPDGSMREAINAAYKADIELFASRVQEFETFLFEAIKASIQDANFTELQNRWEQIKAMVPTMTRPESNLGYTAESSVLPSDQLLVKLQEGARSSIQEIAKLMEFYLHQLHEANLLGRKIQYGPTAMQVTSLELRTEKTTIDQKEFNRMRSLFIQETVKQQRVQIDTIAIRHVHDLVDARQWPFDKFPDPVPDRIQRFLNATPIWMKPYIHIVDGTLVQKRQIFSPLGRWHEVSERVISTHMVDPVVTIGDSWVGAGWLPNEVAHLVSKEKEEAQTKAETRLVMRLLLAAILVAGCLISWTIVAATMGEATEHEQHVQLMLAHPAPIRIPKLTPLFIQGKATPLIYGGIIGRSSARLQFQAIWLREGKYDFQETYTDVGKDRYSEDFFTPVPEELPAPYNHYLITVLSATDQDLEYIITDKK